MSRTKTIKVRIEEYELIKAKADKENITIGEAVKDLIYNNKSMEEIDKHIRSVVEVVAENMEERKREEVKVYKEYLNKQKELEVQQYKDYLEGQITSSVEDKIQDVLNKIENKK